MPQKPQFVTGWFLPVDPSLKPEHPIAPGGPVFPVDPGYGVSEGHPEHPIYNPPGIWGPTDPRPTPPIVIPPLVGIWPSPGHPAHPIVIPDPTPPIGQGGPIYIEGTPDNPIKTNAGVLQPPLPPGSVPDGKVALLVTVVGVEGQRWLTYDSTAQATPK